jgi:hypothetical protein
MVIERRLAKILVHRDLLSQREPQDRPNGAGGQIGQWIWPNGRTSYYATARLFTFHARRERNGH